MDNLETQATLGTEKTEDKVKTKQNKTKQNKNNPKPQRQMFHKYYKQCYIGRNRTTKALYGMEQHYRV